MSLYATFFDSVINYNVCFQNLSESEFNILNTFLEERFKKESYELLKTESNQFHLRYVVWIRFESEQDELKFKLMWENRHYGF